MATHSEGQTPAADLLREKLPGAVQAAASFRGEETIEVAGSRIQPVCRILLEDPAFRFDFLTDLCGVHFPDRPFPFQVVYHLYSFPRHARLRVKALLREGESIASVVPVWPGADWQEREAFDLLGIRFEGHPDLRRIMMPDGFDGHPLRKDFPLEG